MSRRMYPLPGASRKKDFAELRQTLMGFVLFGAIGCVAWFAFFAKGHAEAKAERAFLWSVVYNNQRIQAYVGRVKDAMIEREHNGRRSREAHHRKNSSGVIEGDISFLVIGDKTVRKILVKYRSNHATGEHSVTDISFFSP